LRVEVCPSSIRKINTPSSCEPMLNVESTVLQIPTASLTRPFAFDTPKINQTFLEDILLQYRILRYTADQLPQEFTYAFFFYQHGHVMPHKEPEKSTEVRLTNCAAGASYL